MLLDGVARKQCAALKRIWDRYSTAIHWISVLYEADADRAADHLDEVFSSSGAPR